MSDTPEDDEKPTLMQIEGKNNPDGTPNFDSVEAPTHMDGTPVDKEEAARMHAGLVSGEIAVQVHPEAMAEMEAMGMTIDDIRQLLINASKKTMS